MSSISLRTVATLAAAILLGLIAVILTRSYLSNAVRTNPAVETSNGPAIPVVVTAANVPRGGALQPAMLKVVAYPSGAAPAGAFHSIAELTGAGQQRLALRSMVANEPVLPANISGPGGKLNLSGSVAAGMRAVSLRSNDVAGVGGFVLPGDRVDILLTRTGSGNDAVKESLTQTLAENVRVLGVDQSDNDEADKPVVAKAVTVEVTPEQAASISLGQQIGTVSLTLRRVADDAPLTTKALTVADLGPAPKKSTAPAPTIRVIRGAESTRFSLGVGGALQKAAEQMPTAVKTP